MTSTAIELPTIRMRRPRPIADHLALCQALVERAGEAFLVTDPTGSITYCNAALEELLGHARSDCIGTSIFALVAPPCTLPFQALWRRAGTDAERGVLTCQFRHIDGSARTLCGTLTNFVDHPDVRGFVLTLRESSDAEKRLEDRLQWLMAIVDGSPAAALLADERGRIEYVNRKFTEITGYLPEEVLGKNPKLLQSGRTARNVYERMWATLAAGREFRGELQNRRKNGDVYWANVVVSRVDGLDGRPPRYLGIQTDVTANKLTELALRDTNERFEQLAENIGEVFFVVDAQYRELLYVNAAYETTWGRTRQSLYEDPRSFLNEVHPDDRARVFENVALVQAGKDAGHVEFRIVRSDGTMRWVLAHAIPIRNAAGEVYRISGVVLDVTERRAADARLQEAAARYRRLSEAAFDGVAIAERGVILDVNKAYLSIFGLDSEAEVVGRPFLEMVAEESRAEVQRHCDEGAEGSFEVIGTRKDGRRILLDVTVRAVTIDGRPARVQMLRDVTQQRSLEAQLRQAQKMEAVGRLAGGIAHDFNNLLTVITGHAELLGMEPLAQTWHRESVASIAQAAQNAAALTRQLLAFSRQQVVEPRTIVLEEAVTRTRNMLRHLIGEDIALTTRLSQEPTRVHIDPGQLEQVIMNLAVNARDAMPRGGTLTIETDVVELTSELAMEHWPATPGRFARLAVSDNGIGMDRQTQSRVFEPFFTTKEAGKGTGLGLSTVYGIVQQSHGFISVYSEVGLGTTFKIYLPLSNADPVGEIETEGEPAPTGIETVLLVEDSAAVREIARRALTRQGYSVIDSLDANAALAMAAQSGVHIDLLVTDVVMPRMNGRQLADEFLKLQPHSRVLYMSGYTDDAIVANGVLAAEMPYLQKPFTPQSLARKVRHVLDTP